MIQFVHEYPKGKLLSVYTNDITDDITVGLKKKSYGNVTFIPTELLT